MRVLVDTSAVVALVLRNDRNHAAAVEALRRFTEAGAALVLTNFLVAETYKPSRGQCLPGKGQGMVPSPGERRFSIRPPSGGPLPGKKQPAFSGGAPTVVDFLAPSVGRGAAPGESSAQGRATHHWVEVGGTAEPVRYYRSFVGVVTGGGTMFSCLDSLYAGDFGRGDCDAAV
ncbi:MAG: hypothetical protein H5T97_08310, partial [Firmicutes bacterium]|nr:hypothetical protein [Bacillota bacterium]